MLCRNSETVHGKKLHDVYKAGLGEMGKSTLFLNEKYGNRLILGAIITDIDLPSDDMDKTGEYCVGYGSKKRYISGEELSIQYKELMSKIVKAISLAKEDKISEIKGLNIQMWNMVLLKILILRVLIRKQLYLKLMQWQG